MIAWTPFTHNGKQYDLSHVHPFTMEVIQAATKGKPERTYKINVSFSLHCFTIKDFSEEGLEYSDNRETRYFCFRRYELSKLLPDIIGRIGGMKCYHTGHSNYFIVETVNEEGDITSKYEIYFKISKAGKKTGLNLYVESAYVRDEEYQSSKAKRNKPIRFEILAYNTQTGKPIKIPK